MTERGRKNGGGVSIESGRETLIGESQRKQEEYVKSPLPPHLGQKTLEEKDVGKGPLRKGNAETPVKVSPGKKGQKNQTRHKDENARGRKGGV